MHMLDKEECDPSWEMLRPSCWKDGGRVVDRTPHSKQNWFLQVLHSTEPNVATADSALTTVLQSGVGHHTMDRLAITIASCSRWVYLGRGEKKKGKVKSKIMCS